MPVIMSPLLVSKAAPTLNFEYGATADWRAFAAASIRARLLVAAIQYRKVFEQLRCQIFDLFSGFENFSVGEVFAAAASRQVRNTGQTGHIQATLACNDGFRDSAHANGVRAEFRKGANFGRRFIAGTADGKIDTGL